MSTKAIFQIFEQYKKAKLSFAKSIAELALRSSNVSLLDSENVLGIYNSNI